MNARVVATFVLGLEVPGDAIYITGDTVWYEGDGHIEQREVSCRTLDLQSRSYRPNVLRTKWRFWTNQFAFV
jgi:hypothetical protein